MAIDLNDLDAVISLLDDKLIRTENGAYIKVEDLRSLKQEFEEMKRTEREGDKSIKTLAAARLKAMNDPELTKHFQPTDSNPVPGHVNAVKE